MKKLYKLFSLLCLVIITNSCESYLDRPKEAELGLNEVFENFDNSQGFVEEM